jgi:ATP-dependent helicase/DNAse subunit B
MDPLVRGTAIHLVLEQFLRDFGAINFGNSIDELWGALESRARKILNDARPPGLADLLWEVECDSLLRTLKSWLEFEKSRAGADMHVSRLEQIFGGFAGEENYPALRVEAGRHSCSFRGRIDRIDISSDRKKARVVDYKTGSLPESMARSSRTPLMSGEKIQLLIYAEALSVLAEFSGVETIEGEYLHLQPKNGLTVPCSYTSEELQAARKALPEILKLAGNGIETGVFFAKTSGKVYPSGHCEYCDYISVCGKDRVRREERKSKDPIVRTFLDIVEPL